MSHQCLIRRFLLMGMGFQAVGGSLRHQCLKRRKFQSRYQCMKRRIWMGRSVQKQWEVHSIQWRSRAWYKATTLVQTGMRHQRVQRRFRWNLSVLATPVEDQRRQGEAMRQWRPQTAADRSVPATLVELWRWTWEAGSMARSARGEGNQLGLKRVGFNQLGLKRRVMM